MIYELELWDRPDLTYNQWQEWKNYAEARSKDEPFYSQLAVGSPAATGGGKTIEEVRT